MDSDIRDKHLEHIDDPRAIALYDALCRECEQQYGALPEGAQHIIGDIAMMEQTKRALYRDIAERGVTELFKNGRQSFYRENKSIQAARALVEQQRKCLNELKLTPASLKIAPEARDDEFNEF